MNSSTANGANLKLLLIGNSSVGKSIPLRGEGVVQAFAANTHVAGKSSLLLRFTDDEFLSDEETAATIGVDFKVKSIEIDGKKHKLSIWDTAGQERFRTLTSSYYRGAQGVVLVYDVTSRQTFDELLKWFKEIDTYCGEGVVKIVVGNKVDKEFSRQVTTAEGQAFAQRTGALFLECSAKTNMGVPKAFEELVKQILARPSLWATVPTAQQATAPIKLEQQQSGWVGGCRC